ncbi:DEAD/DEAH box helicase [Staphylococcus nepalensis]|uniref:DEAD/DEAH box helicase n=1 Tax=Staphylococcus nepalensis TaxID=214473 RepID=A0ABS3L5U7_9STAP|nr:DEAD/DEAH box helicase [Staphylococcus nepalensis]MBO1212158.1 DEAD/DEAH box helicase [Staphylococcus nepalensis]MBO1216868.1 DEAD/DEAH box helicase [Staphylococcus nepalensis]MBO1228418.1 DEAD/DEAH box helicase [Staphylococcus nepalensis]MBO1235466.1 DEAD/DEAH box helicase [Staphylococcus nepalensis]MBO1238255.1 DEAD/DEAH box helicase [Staphylococcus nepalensis]
MDNLLEDFNQSLYKGFIDRTISHKGNFMPKLLINNKDENVLSTIINELYKCKSFTISVAFITESGLASLKSHLYDLNQKGVRGKIITSNYLGFNTPKMYKELLKLKNVDVRLTDVNGFHAKCYIFEHERYASMIVGSSNLTSNALKINYEHNILLSTQKNGDLIYNIKAQFDELWNKSIPLSDAWIRDYQLIYDEQAVKNTLYITKEQSVIQNNIEQAVKIEPNIMQKEALQSLAKLRKNGKNKSLIISATGTGKTILCALDVRNYNPNKFLFIVHNEGILQRSIEEFKKVLPFSKDEDFGLLTGKHKESHAKYLFATIQTLSKSDIYNQFGQNHFDYIVYDEAHRSAAKSYQKVFNYFTPDFVLGMTATPERTDNLNIFEIFDYNIAYEIRLQKALESKILCPFHYFGVTEYIHNGKPVDDFSSLTDLTSDERVRHVLEKTQYYGYSGEELKGLIFVSRKDEAKELADKLTLHNLPSVSLTGEDNSEKRQQAIEQLKSGEINYIVTVNLFNEGIDITPVNQIVMLRETESSIIFIQQLGRGLRKSENKEYVTVIDFIGNYKKNYLIPIALSGDQSQNKDNYRKFLTSNTALMGVSTINFEEVAKKKIYDSLKQVKLSAASHIKQAYNEVEQRIGRMPLLMDFIRQNSIDPSVIYSKDSSYKNYNDFLVKSKKIEEQLNKNENLNLTFLSREIAPGLKNIDHTILNAIIDRPYKINELLTIAQNLDPNVTLEDVQTTLKILDYSFFSDTINKTYGKPIITISNDEVTLTKSFAASLEKPLFKIYLEDIIELAQYNNKTYQKNQNRLLLYNKYTRKDFVKLLNWKSDESGVINGYKFGNNTLPIFITYHKEDNISDNTKYEDEFLSPDELKWFTKSNRKLDSPEVQKILAHQNNNVDMYIFVKKEDVLDGNEFYFLGKAHYLEGTAEQSKMPNENNDNIVTMTLSMETPVKDEIYRYILDT